MAELESNEIELLKHLHIRARDGIDFHRERQDKIFMWSSNIFLLVIGALLIVDPSKSILWSGQGVLGKSVASITIFVLAIFSIHWQQRNRKWQEESVEVLEKIDRIFHCFDKGYFGMPDDVALFPERWAKPRDARKRLGLIRRVFRVNYVSATFLLGLLAIAMIWLSGP